MREVQGLTYDDFTGSGVAREDFDTPSGDGAAAKLSEDGKTITWKVVSADVNLGDSNTGFQVTIGGIKANASTVGNGEDVTAVVRVGGEAAHSDSSLKLADVTTGLAVKVAKADILQCEAGTTGGIATVTIQEGFADAIVDTNEFMVSFIGIPEGVTVKVPVTIPALTVVGDVTAAMAEASIGLMLKTGRTSVTVAAGMGTVVLSSSGSGEVTYEVANGTTADTGAKEWVDVEVTFSWKSGNVIDSGEVAVSFDPVSTMGGDTFMDDEGAPAERYVASGSHTIIDVSPCETTMLFPYVTGKLGYYTGIAITNTSSQSGSCTVNFIGEDQPEALESSEIVAKRQWVFMTPEEFQGYLTVDCNFQNGRGFAFIGNNELSVAHGYLAEVE